MAIRPSSSKIVDVESITTEGADIVEYTTYGITLLGSDFLETGPAIFLIDGSVRLRFASPTTLFYIFLCIADNCRLFSWGWGKLKESVRVKS